MKENEFEKFVNERYIDQINWYSSKATRFKRFYVIFQWGVIILSSIVPVLIAVLDSKFQFVTISLSIILAIGTAGLKTFKFQENWINYRTISETLKKEKYYYEAELDNYSASSDKEALFVERVESLISRENSLWVITHTQKEEKGE